MKIRVFVLWMIFVISSILNAKTNFLNPFYESINRSKEFFNQNPMLGFGIASAIAIWSFKKKLKYNKELDNLENKIPGFSKLFSEANKYAAQEEMRLNSRVWGNQYWTVKVDKLALYNKLLKPESEQYKQLTTLYTNSNLVGLSGLFSGCISIYFLAKLSEKIYSEFIKDKTQDISNTGKIICIISLILGIQGITYALKTMPEDKFQHYNSYVANFLK